MAYLFKHTPLQTNFPVNLTCLIPTENPLVGKPERLDLQGDSLALPRLPARRRDARASSTSSTALDRSAFTSSRASRRSSTRSTRSSRSSASPTARQTPPKKIMTRFGLDAEQTDAILELKLYRLAQARDPGHSERTGREAGAGEGDCEPAQARDRPVEAGPSRDRGYPESLRRRPAVRDHR